MTAHVGVHREGANLLRRGHVPSQRDDAGDVFPVLADDREGRQHGGIKGVHQQCLLDAEPGRQAAQHRLALSGCVELRTEDASHGRLRSVSMVRHAGQPCRTVRTRAGSTLRARTSRAGGGAASSVYVRSPWRAAANAGNRSAASACACSEGAAASASAWSMMRFESIRTVPSSQTSVGALTTGLIAANCAKPQTARSRK